MEPYLHKIKLLLALTTSPNQNEADNARAMADKLIAKYKVTPAQLDSLKEKDNTIPGEQVLFKTAVHSEWKSTLAYLVSSKYNCYVMQEKWVWSGGDTEYQYFVFGGEADVESVKYLFKEFVWKVEDLVTRMCYGRGDIYVGSYCEGVVNGLRSLLENEFFRVPKSKEDAPKEAAPAEPGLIKTSTLTNPSEKPTEKTIEVNTKNTVKDIQAYFRGVKDSDLISFDNLLEEYNED